MFKYIILFMKIRQRRMPWPTDVLLKHGVFTIPKMTLSYEIPSNEEQNVRMTSDVSEADSEEACFLKLIINN